MSAAFARQAAPPVEAQAIRLPEALKRRIDNALVERHPMLLAHLGPDGQPILSFRGSVQSFGDDQLALWVRAADGGFVHAIRANPKVALMYRDEDAKANASSTARRPPSGPTTSPCWAWPWWWTWTASKAMPAWARRARSTPSACCATRSPDERIFSMEQR